MPYIEADDSCRNFYRLDGPEDPPILLLANSLGTTLEMWEPQLAPLLGGWRVLRYDSRGHGRSDAPPGPYDILRLGRDVLALLDADHARLLAASITGPRPVDLDAAHLSNIEQVTAFSRNLVAFLKSGRPADG
jgi:pimeloyl-ACP methyl ester carboxylesterase